MQARGQLCRSLGLVCPTGLRGAGRGVGELREYLLGRATPGAWTLEPDAVTDRTDEELALEVVRENIFRRFYEGEACRCQGPALGLLLSSSRPLLWTLPGTDGCWVVQSWDFCWPLVVGERECIGAACAMWKGRWED